MSSEFGKKLRVSVFGESHGPGIGVVVNGFPAGESVDPSELNRFLARRAPGNSSLTTARKEADLPEFLSGIRENVLTGSPFAAIIRNTNQRFGDYKGFEDTPRPSHADYTAAVKWNGAADMRGGGHFSGRLTAPICIAGGIALQILARRGIFVGAHLSNVGGIADDPFPPHPTPELLRSIAEKEFPVIDSAKGSTMQEVIRNAAADGDSVGAAIECAAIGTPAGLGDPMFDGVESLLSAALFGVPGVKGVSFGSGFDCVNMRGSEHNDPFVIENGTVQTASNHSGGIQGGITNGMPIVFQIAMKPTASIAKKQQTVSLSGMSETEIAIHGRHDPCIAIRAVPVVEAVTALCILDLTLGK
ncbi:MAG: chorismate synthase [Flexilinea sp.]|nr:chorismate synthase [Flexilinea sp.]